MRIAAKAIVSVGLLLWLFHGIGISEFASNVARTSWQSVALVWVLQTALVFLQAERWLIIARRLGIKLAFWRALQSVYVGQFFNQVFPSSIGGDAMRIWSLKCWAIPLNVAIASVVMERIVALFAVPLIAFMGLSILLDIVSPWPLRWALVTLFCGFAIALPTLLWLDLIPLPRMIERLRIVNLVRRTPAIVRQVFLSWHCISRATLLSMMIHAGVGTSFWLLAFGLGVRASLVDFVVLAPLVILITIVPISIGGWGVREGAMMAAMSLIGIPDSTSLVVSVEFGLVMILVGMPGGLVWLLDKGQALRES
jgi:glycosyltransferase 2 family protein